MKEKYQIDAKQVIISLYERGLKAKEIAKIVGLTAGQVAAIKAHFTMGTY